MSEKIGAGLHPIFDGAERYTRQNPVELDFLDRPGQQEAAAFFQAPGKLAIVAVADQDERLHLGHGALHDIAPAAGCRADGPARRRTACDGSDRRPAPRRREPHGGRVRQEARSSGEEPSRPARRSSTSKDALVRKARCARAFPAAATSAAIPVRRPRARLGAKREYSAMPVHDSLADAEAARILAALIFKGVELVSSEVGVVYSISITIVRRGCCCGCRWSLLPLARRAVRRVPGRLAEPAPVAA